MYTYINGNGLFKSGVIEFYSLVDTLDLEKRQADFSILIKNKKLIDLNSNLPFSGKEQYKKAILVNHNTSQVYKGKVRYRGDSRFHWLYKDKSWRFKASKGDLVDGDYKINFIIVKGNELLNNHLSYRISSFLGLLTPKSEMKTLSVNGEYNGLKVLTEQLGEGFLRRNNRMPNDLYVGDNVRKYKDTGVEQALLSGPYVWEKAAYNNHYPKDNMQPLKYFIKDIKEHNFNRISLNDFAKFSILRSLTGSRHVDDNHNWRIYYDSYYEKFFPITWDLVGWIDSFRGSIIDKSNSVIPNTNIMRAMFTSYEFLYLRKIELLNLLEKKEELIALLDFEVDNVIGKIKLHNYSMSIHQNIMDRSETIEEVTKLQKHIVGRIDAIEKAAFSEGEYKWAFSKKKIILSVTGRSIIKKIKIKLDRSLTKVPKSYIHYQVLDKKYKEDITNLGTVSKDGITFDLPLFSNLYKHGGSIDFAEATYELEVDGMVEDQIKQIEFNHLNLNSSDSKVSKVNFLSPKVFFYKYMVMQDKKINTEIWSGVKNITGFNVVTDNVVIRPGTKIIFDENSTLKILGKITAIGTEKEPIIFEAKDKMKPWNALVLKDSGANGSVFKYCTFQDGSGVKSDLYEYTAMLSIHNVKDLLVDKCEFTNNHKTDDMVHVIYSDVVFRNTKFVRSLSDALDVDISNVIVDRCEFLDSGNDSIDLMTSNAIVTNTTFLNSKDKGISIGEGSNLLAINNVIKNNEIGMQSKDTSKAYIYDTSFIGNKKAVDAYHKNWRYSEGGEITLDNSLFENNIVNATVGKKSKVIINNSTIDTPDNFDAKSIKKGKIVLSHEKMITPDFNLDFFGNASALMHEKGVPPL